MSSDFSPELRKELLDDFYAECDELLTNVRESLTELEAEASEGNANLPIIEALFRSLHSLKGISAIVGLRAAEELAHAAEELLRGWSKQLIPATADAIDALIDTAQQLEQIVTCHRLAKTLPSTAELIERLQGFSPAKKNGRAQGAIAEITSAENPSAKDAAPDLVQAAADRGLHVWQCEFTPTPALDQRGVNINAVRARLSEIGEIIRATPSVRGKGRIVFEFLVALRAAPVDAELTAWQNDGMQFTPVAPASVDEKPGATATPSVASEAVEALSLTPSHMVRVDLSRLDELMRIAGEMVVLRSRLEDRINLSGNAGSELKEINVGLGRSLREMREAIARVRLVPIAEIFTRMPFVVRDLTRESGKEARIVLEGHQTEVDKFLVERLKEPLLHLVRNAFAHGIERSAEREAAGKPAGATIVLRATSIGDSVQIQIRDDGRGIDAEAIRLRAASLGLATPASFDDSALLGVLCTPGFSTRDEADLAAGRGVGMAVVANTVRELGGTLTLSTTPGRGTEFTLRLPLTLSIADVLIVSVGAEICAVPQSAVSEIIQVPATAARTIQQTEVVPYRGALLPFLRLSALFRHEASASPTLTLLIVSTDRGATGLAVERIHSQREAVIRPLTDPLLHVPEISGATDLGDGRPVLILDPVALTLGVVRPPEASLPAETKNSSLAS